jgi:hypothetical protein
MRTKASDIFYALLPLLIHGLLSNIIAILFGSMLDAATLTTLTAVVLLPVFLVLYRKDRKEERVEDLPGRKEIQVPWVVYPLMVCLGVSLNLLLTKGMEAAGVTEQFSNATQESLLGSQALVQIFGLGILVPVMEEYLFRGLLYRRLKGCLPVGAAILLGSAIFALYHGNMVQILFAFPMGLVILLCYEKWQKMAVPILFHMAVNMSTVLIELLI